MHCALTCPDPWKTGDLGKNEKAREEQKYFNQKVNFQVKPLSHVHHTLDSVFSAFQRWK